MAFDIFGGKAERQEHNMKSTGIRRNPGHGGTLRA